jgi:hypothetical protein
MQTTSQPHNLTNSKRYRPPLVTMIFAKHYKNGKKLPLHPPLVAILGITKLHSFLTTIFFNSMLICSIYPNATCEALSHSLQAASVGSVWFLTQGSFRSWTLSTDQGIQAALGMGPARGPARPPSYHRAEGYGLLSILRFLIRLSEYTGMTDPWEAGNFSHGQSKRVENSCRGRRDV